MTAIQGSVPPGAREITTGQTNRVWYIASPTPCVLKHYGDPRRAANEAAALALLSTHNAPAPRLLGSNPTGDPAWTVQSAVHAEPIQADRFLEQVGEALAHIHRISGSHAGRLAGARPHRTWADYLHDRLSAYATAAPDLARHATVLHDRVDATVAEIMPRLLHHDLQPGHLVRCPASVLMLLDWELAAFGDPLSDFARLAVRLRQPDPTKYLVVAYDRSPDAGHRIVLYWHIHLLADAALATNPCVKHYARSHLERRPGG